VDGSRGNLSARRASGSNEGIPSNEDAFSSNDELPMVPVSQLSSMKRGIEDWSVKE